MTDDYSFCAPAVTMGEPWLWWLHLSLFILKVRDATLKTS